MVGGGGCYKGEGWTQRDQEVIGIGVYNVKFPKNR